VLSIALFGLYQAVFVTLAIQASVWAQMPGDDNQKKDRLVATVSFIAFAMHHVFLAHSMRNITGSNLFSSACCVSGSERTRREKGQTVLSNTALNWYSIAVTLAVAAMVSFGQFRYPLALGDLFQCLDTDWVCSFDVPFVTTPALLCLVAPFFSFVFLEFVKLVFGSLATGDRHRA
jgi:hypothetical protein